MFHLCMDIVEWLNTVSFLDLVSDRDIKGFEKAHQGVIYYFGITVMTGKKSNC